MRDGAGDILSCSHPGGSRQNGPVRRPRRSLAGEIWQLALDRFRNLFVSRLTVRRKMNRRLRLAHLPSISSKSFPAMEGRLRSVLRGGQLPPGERLSPLVVVVPKTYEIHLGPDKPLVLMPARPGQPCNGQNARDASGESQGADS